MLKYDTIGIVWSGKPDCLMVVSIFNLTWYSKLMSGASKQVTIIYRNWRGETTERRVLPTKLWFGKTKYHPEEQWLLRGHDVEKNAERDFAVKDIKAWRI